MSTRRLWLFATQGRSARISSYGMVPGRDVRLWSLKQRDARFHARCWWLISGHQEDEAGRLVEALARGEHEPPRVIGCGKNSHE